MSESFNAQFKQQVLLTFVVLKFITVQWW